MLSRNSPKVHFTLPRRTTPFTPSISGPGRRSSRILVHLSLHLSVVLTMASGNSEIGSYSSSENLSESAVKVSNDLTSVLSFFIPSNVNGLDGSDGDYGSGGFMLLLEQPGRFPHVRVAAGKDGRMFVFNRDSLGGFSPLTFPPMFRWGAVGAVPPTLRTTLSRLSVLAW
jgi:hypothetical protein